LAQLRAIERKLLQLLRRLPEVLAQARVIVDELRIVENEVLANESFQRGRLLVELPAGASGLRGLQHGLLALGPEAVEADDQLDQRVQQRQADEQETEQNELEK